MAIGMINALTKAHADAHEVGEDTPEILDKLHDLTVIMLLTGAIFAGLAFISMICRVKYRGVAGKSPEDVEDDIQKMLRAKTRLLEN